MVNYLAVVLAAVAAIIIGMVWYSPKLGFGKMWMKLAEITDKQIKTAKEKGMARPMIANLIATLVMVLVLANFITIGDVRKSMITVFWLWLGLVATINLGSVLWENKPVKLYILNTSYWLVTMSVMASILSVLV